MLCRSLWEKRLYPRSCVWVTEDRFADFSPIWFNFFKAVSWENRVPKAWNLKGRENGKSGLSSTFCHPTPCWGLCVGFSLNHGRQFSWRAASGSLRKTALPSGISVYGMIVKSAGTGVRATGMEFCLYQLGYHIAVTCVCGVGKVLLKFTHIYHPHLSSSAMVTTILNINEWTFLKLNTTCFFPIQKFRDSH